MSFINVYGDEIDAEPETGSVLSHPDQNKTIYAYAAWINNNGTPVCRGDPVYMVNLSDSEEHKSFNGLVASYYDNHEDGTVNAIVGIALADAKYGANDLKSEKPIPILVAGDVIATVPAAPIKVRGNQNAGLRGHFYPGEYVSADGVVSTSEVWRLADQLVLGQILAGKTRANRDEIETGDAQATANRLHHRPNDDRDYYHIPIRLTVGSVLAVGTPIYDKGSIVEAVNDTGETLQQNDIVMLVYYANSAQKWSIAQKSDGAGNFSSGFVTDPFVEPDDSCKVMVTGSVKYNWEDAAAMMAKSNPTRLTPLVAKMKAAAATNSNEEIDFSSYYVGQRVTDTLHPIMDGVPDNQFGVIEEIDPGLDGGTPSITVKLDPVSTDSPAYEANAVVDAGKDIANLPVGTSLIENPITHKLVPCRYDTDNVDATVIESVELPQIVGWGLAQYKFVYGDGVYEYNGRFWQAIKKFGKGVYKKVIKPAAKWAISIVAPVAGTYVTALGNVMQARTATICAQLINSITPPTPHLFNAPASYRTIHGETVTPNDGEEILQEYVDFGGSYRDTHPNATYVYDINAPTEENTPWQIGDCLRVNPTTGKAVLVTSPDTPIEAVVNFAPAQDPESNGWKIAGVARGYHEIRSNNLKVGSPVLFDGSDATNRLAQKLATAIIGYVREVWQPSTATLAAVKAGKLPADEELPNCIVEVKPEFFEEGVARDWVIAMQYHDPEGLTSNANNGDGGQND